MVWGPTKGDIQAYLHFYYKFIASNKKLMAGIREAERRRWRYLRRIRPSDASLDEPAIQALSAGRSSSTDSTTGPRLKYIDLEPDKQMPIPKMTFFGDSTQDIVNKYGAQPLATAVEHLPRYSHQYITLPLEQGMELLLKLYARQLPDQSA
jgi:hypothetical protein